MFCPECGTKNDDAAKFCENCGNKLETNNTTEQTVAADVNSDSNDNVTESVTSGEVSQNVNQTVNTVDNNTTQNLQPRQKMSMKTKVIIAVAAILIVAAVIINSNLEKSTDPETIAKNYFEDVANAKWDDVYGYYDLSESKFVNKKMYTKAVKDKDKIEYTNYAVKSRESLEDILEDADESSSEDEDDGIYKTVVIQYAEKGSNSSNDYYTVKLVKQQKKKFLFYDNWKVVPDEMVVKDYKITTLSGLDVKVDGVKLDKSYIETDDDNDDDDDYDSYSDNYTTYTIESIFEGKHEVEISGEFIETHKKTVECEKYSSSMYSYSDFDIKEDFEKKVKEDSKEVVKKIYAAALENKKFEDLDVGYEFNKEDEDSYDYMVDDYEDLVENMDDTSFSSDIKVSKLDIKEFEIKDDNVYLDSQGVRVYISFSLDYKGEFVKTNSDKKEEKESKEDSTGGNITFKYIDGEWKISNMYFNSIYMYF